LPITASVAPTSGPIAWAATDVRVDDPGALFPGDIQGLFEPAVAIDPTDPDVLVAFSQDFGTQNLDVNRWTADRGYRSLDGGATWIDMGVTRYDDPNAIWDGGDDVLAFAPDGTAYHASLGYNFSATSIYVHKSTDGGATWGVPVQAVAPTRDDETNDCSAPDKEWLKVDPTSGALYLTWTDFHEPCETLDPFFGLDGLVPTDVGVDLSVSHDGGATWSAPQRIVTGWAFGQPDVGPDGTLYVTAWTSVPTPIDPCPSALGVVAAKQAFGAVVVASSTDGGATWRRHTVGVCSFPELADAIHPGRVAGGNFMTAMTVDDATGAAIVAYPTFSPTDGRYVIDVISSLDGGATWSASPRAAVGGLDHTIMPAIVAKGGLAVMSFLLARNDGTGDVAAVTSSDGGATWSAPTILTSASSQMGRLPDVGPRRDPMEGDYMTIDLVGTRVVAIWTDARNGDPTEIWARVGTIAGN
jgi:hypothetical protein